MKTEIGIVPSLVLNSIAMVFLTSCGTIPADSSTQDEDVQNESNSCAKRDLDSCEFDTTCVLLQGHKRVVADTCYAEMETPYACVEKDTLAGGAMTLALSIESECWLLPSTYAPPGWQTNPAAVDTTCPPEEDMLCD